MLFLLVVLVALATSGQCFECPKENGTFPDAIQCDKYYECKNGTAIEELCPDGLVFGTNITRFGKCDHPFRVDCTNRTKLQPAQRVNEHCPRKNGVFYPLDLTRCDIFVTCDDGYHSENNCVDTLHFHEESGECVWPDIAGRENCQEVQKELANGFSCPKANKKNGNSARGINPRYPHPEDCQKFYICVGGNDPRELICDDPTEVFNEDTSLCDKPENVAGCEDWFDE